MGIKAGIDLIQGVILVRHDTVRRALLQIDFIGGVILDLVAGREAREGGAAIIVLDAGEGGVLAVGGDAGGVGFRLGQRGEGEVL